MPDILLDSDYFIFLARVQTRFTFEVGSARKKAYQLRQCDKLCYFCYNQT